MDVLLVGRSGFAAPSSALRAPSLRGEKREPKGRGTHHLISRQRVETLREALEVDGDADGFCGGLEDDESCLGAAAEGLQQLVFQHDLGITAVSEAAHEIGAADI